MNNERKVEKSKRYYLEYFELSSDQSPTNEFKVVLRLFDKFCLERIGRERESLMNSLVMKAWEAKRP